MEEALTVSLCAYDLSLGDLIFLLVWSRIIKLWEKRTSPYSLLGCHTPLLGIYKYPHPTPIYSFSTPPCPHPPNSCLPAPNNCLTVNHAMSLPGDASVWGTGLLSWGQSERWRLQKLDNVHGHSDSVTHCHPGLTLKVGKMNCSLGNLDPDWAIGSKSGQNYSRSATVGKTFFFIMIKWTTWNRHQQISLWEFQFNERFGQSWPAWPVLGVAITASHWQ